MVSKSPPTVMRTPPESDRSIVPPMSRFAITAVSKKSLPVAMRSTLIVWSTRPSLVIEPPSMNEKLPPITVSPIV